MTEGDYAAAHSRGRGGWAVALLVAGLLTAPGLTAVPAAAAEPTDGSVAPAPTGTVTLLTGERVALAPDGHLSVIEAPGRTDVPLYTYQRDGHAHLLPADAAPLVAAGQVDPQLFDITALLEAGYGDADRDDLPLIMTNTSPSVDGVLEASGVTVTGDLPAVAGVSAVAAKDHVGGFWEELVTPGPTGTRPLDGDTGLWLDAPLRVQLDQSVPQVGAPDAWATGFDGSGTTVAVLDTGIDADHPDLAGKVTGQANFTIEGDADLHGHGTHVASTVAGTGTASGGERAGTAPGASLLDGKVCTAGGDCLTSDMIEGMQWAAEQGADVVNLSIGGPDTTGVDPLEEAVESLTTSHDTLFVIAAGNNGGARTVNSPASAEAALAVGAVDGDDAIAGFSSRGPRVGDAGLKPEITAPGVTIDAARSADSDRPGEAYTTLSGTSMATPHVAGAAAILVQGHPDWSADQLKAALMGAADPHPMQTPFTQGAGRLRVPQALDLPVTATPAAVSLGFIEAGDGETLTRTVTYRNSTDGELTLDLTLETLGTGGTAPANLFGLNTTSLTVPAGGEAAVTLTTTIAASLPAGIYGGWLVASDGVSEVRTPFGFERAVPLTFEHIGRTGGPPVAYTTFVMRVDGPEQFILSGTPGPATVWAPAGTYLVLSSLIDVGPGGEEQTVLTVPRLEVSTPESFLMDAREADPVAVEVPDPEAQLWSMEIGFQLDLPDGDAFSITSAVRSGSAYLAAVGAGPETPGLRTKITSDLIVPGPEGDEHDSPRAYHLGWFLDGGVPAGFAPEVTEDDLATVTARHAAHIEGGLGYKTAVAQPVAGVFSSGITFGLPADLPFERTERYRTGGDLRWVTRFSEHVASTNAHVVTTSSAPLQYAPGSAQQQSWNRPVYWPTLAAPATPGDWVTRVDDQLRFLLPIFGDGDGRAGRPDTATVTGEVTITRAGEILHEGPYEPDFGRVVPVPPEAGTYQLTVDVERSEPAVLATRLGVVWTFGSNRPSGSDPVRMPLWTVQMTPQLAAGGTAPAGGTFAIPLRAQPQDGSPAAALTGVSVEFSTDDGQTWQPAAVSSAGGGTHLAELTHPDEPGFVSLRARAADAAGNAVEQEVIRAYRIA